MRQALRIHQFHSGAAPGDAITNQMFSLQHRLRQAGYDSEIFAQYIDPTLASRVKSLVDLREGRSTILLVHHSMGYTAFDQVMALKVPIIPVFHCITPAHFFDDPTLRSFVNLGLRQLSLLARRSSFGIAASNHNRRQMLRAGFTDVAVLPVRTDFSDIRGARNRRRSASNDWLFVGRVVPNKRQVEIVQAFGAFSRVARSSSRLHLVGDLSMHDYVGRVRQEISRLGLEERVVLHGKVPGQDLVACYRDAGLFVSLSEHEGFGVPLLEAMAAGLPVIARNEAAIAETMGGAGVLLSDGSPELLAAAARVVLSDRAMRTRLIEHQDQRLARIENFDVEGFLERLIERVVKPDQPLSVQVQGPFETSYSLATLNRELAGALSSYPDLSVSIYPTEGPGDYLPRAEDLALYPEATRLFEAAAGVPYPDVVIRQMFPPRVNDSLGGLTFQYFGWEETRVPQAIADDFNRHLDGIGAMSNFVRDLLRNSGVTVPIEVVGVGVHCPDPAATLEAPELSGLRRTRLLHISSAFPRKGVDRLLEAYFGEFTGSDDVSLILKTFPNPHNDVAAILTSLRAGCVDPPHVAWIDRDLDRRAIDALYRLADGYVHAARGEGFGLPVAEAMLAEVPVISVAATGLADFVSPRTAAVIGHRWVPSLSHLSSDHSMWAEPDINDLRREMRLLVEAIDADTRAARVSAARSLVAQRFSWAEVAERWRDFVLETRAEQRAVRVAAVTTYNSRCGIAEYSALLYGAMGDRIQLEVHADNRTTPLTLENEVGVIRSWPNGRGSIAGLKASLHESNADLVHIQHNMGFFRARDLGGLIRREVARRPVVVTLHRTHPLRAPGVDESMTDIAEDLRLADAIIVHQNSDRERLAASGVTTNVHVIRLGTEAVVAADMHEARIRHGLPESSLVLGTYGFLLPHKGLIKLLEAVSVLRSAGIDARVMAACALHPDPSSHAHLEVVQDKIRSLRLERAVRLCTDYLDSASSRDLLACADVLVLPYEETLESASAALRSVLPLGRPVITSDLGIFEDVRGVAITVPAPVDPGGLARVIENLWLDDEVRESHTQAVRKFSAETSWSITARRTLDLYDEVIRARGVREVGEAAQ